MGNTLSSGRNGSTKQPQKRGCIPAFSAEQEHGMSPDSAAAATTGLKLQTYTWEDAVVVQCAGRLTAEYSDALKSHVKRMIPNAPRIILDLNGVTRMDSSGLGALVGLYTSAKKAGCNLQLINYNKSIKDLFGITNLLSVFEACAQAGTRFP
jgi:anti-sigma B factor antagonist